MRLSKILIPFVLILGLFLVSCNQEIKHLTYRDIVNCTPGIYNASDLGIDDYWFKLYGEYPKTIILERDDGVCKWYINNIHTYNCKYNKPEVEDIFRCSGLKCNDSLDVYVKDVSKVKRAMKLSIYYHSVCKMDEWFGLKVSAYELRKETERW